MKERQSQLLDWCFQMGRKKNSCVEGKTLFFFSLYSTIVISIMTSVSMPDLSRCCCCSCCCSVWWWWWWVGTKGHDDSPLQTPPMVKIRPAHQTVALAHHLFFPFLVYFKIFFLTWFHSDFYDNFSVFDFVVFFFLTRQSCQFLLFYFLGRVQNHRGRSNHLFLLLDENLYFFSGGGRGGTVFSTGGL